MTDIRRSILWMVFGFSMILLWDKWQLHNGQPATFFPQPPSATAKAEADSKSSAKTTTGTGSVPTATAVGGGLPPSTMPAAPRVTTVITTDVLKLSFDSEGGSLVGADLLQHKAATLSSKNQEDKPLTLLTQTPNHTYIAQTGLVGGSGLPTHKTPMVWVKGDTELKDGQNELIVRFESASDGVKMVKTYTLRRGAYDIAVSHEVINTTTAEIKPQLYMQLVRDGSTNASETPFYSTFTGPAIFTQVAKYQKVEFPDIEKNKATFQKTAADGYVAMVQHYFATAWLLGDGIEREHFVRKIDNNLYSAGLITAMPAIAPESSQSVQARLFVGPQAEKVLETVAPGLELVKDYGWLTMLAKPLYWLLEKIHGVVGNWGWAIVLLVVLIKAAFYWLNATAYRSMAKMKAVTPRITEMRERLKDNPQQMQMEMMRIYREEKVNPMGGCFPIMIQIPVFIALYWVLLSSVEMRNAPWVAWITDMSSPDPWYILPFIMTLTTIFQTALNPLPPDPMQAKLMWIMPLVFSVMFFFFPAGLVLYWITNNILTIAQQAFINHRMGVPVKFTMPDFKS
uniref:Membrane protein insertase YidC n=1 Tax=uncultured bacterium A1Q1_fos_500 TaxID=1256579 RepID=L7W0K6_9BACT|nr:inner membrane protein translocase component YidC, long form [uncultured bacterium A1Q1_fos_500]